MIGTPTNALPFKNSVVISVPRYSLPGLNMSTVLNFPTFPTLEQEYIFKGIVFVFKGDRWKIRYAFNPNY